VGNGHVATALGGGEKREAPDRGPARSLTLHRWKGGSIPLREPLAPSDPHHFLVNPCVVLGHLGLIAARGTDI
jgi:hypothetical protein